MSGNRALRNAKQPFISGLLGSKPAGKSRKMKLIDTAGTLKISKLRFEIVFIKMWVCKGSVKCAYNTRVHNKDFALILEAMKIPAILHELLTQPTYCLYRASIRYFQTSKNDRKEEMARHYSTLKQKCYKSVNKKSLIALILVTTRRNLKSNFAKTQNVLYFLKNNCRFIKVF